MGGMMKRLILCCDGTWNKADQEDKGVPCPTNVVRISCRIAKADTTTPQIIYYDQGVGTGNILDRYSGGAFGNGIEDNIKDAYRFLIGNYEFGDEIFLFGFSRGAFTVRSIAGMVRKCGVLGREHVEHYSEAFDLYRSEYRPTDEKALKFRKDYSVGNGADIKIKLIGVWDTVGALGIPLRGLRSLTNDKHQFHDTELSGVVEYAYHALAIDERRAPFEPTLWMYKPKPGQTIEQTWFCGVHSDVGGGYPERGLSEITLEWMMQKAQGAGLKFDAAAVRAHAIRPDPLASLHQSKTGLYRLTPGSDREIGLISRNRESPDQGLSGTDPTQSLHESVLIRWDSDAEYRPEGLREYFKRTGDRRANDP